MKNLFLVSIVCALIFIGYLFVTDSHKTPIKHSFTPTILLSIDGFSNDYLQRFKPKNILMLAEGGVKAKSLTPVFPSKTFPNHISIVTGNYPATHGVIHNSFYNRALDKNYKLGLGKEDPNWLRSPTLWSIAEQNEIKTAIYFWPESEINTTEYKPTYVKPYKHNTPNEQRFNQIVEWLKMPVNERPSLVLGYFSTIDSAGHDYGTSSQELKKAIDELDYLLGQFITNLKHNLDYEVNIVLVSDHGMTNISPKTILYNHLFEGMGDVRIVDGQTQLFIYLPEVDKTKEATLVSTIKSRLTPLEKASVNVYDFVNYPKHWHFNTRSSVMPNVVLEVLPPYVFGKPREKGNATHGYNPKLTSELDAIFIANGPSFKKGLIIEPFENIYVFPMMLSLLGLELPENNDADKNILLPIFEENSVKFN
ncbi:ectonucleotide pyrophosphatase/phosphodiesterase [Pseudocolwellia agarivorans]|uniref:alkaline phosphatase family protein n=1 Tax=Pseudocolwellia agarivorans TaxID=1911682 RepID=UPI0009842E61|nr:ectonucleotide pyrophosphatase/phosphodiesterase [Pseudocolwellia agarivorans]